MIKTKKEFDDFVKAANCACMKAGFVCPNANDIKLYTESVCNYKHDSSKYAIKVAGSIALADSNGSIGITITGEIKKLSDAAKTALYSGTDVTHATVLLATIPESDYTKVTYKRNSNGTPTALTDCDVVVIDGITYFVLVVGMYDNSGTVCDTTQFTLSNGIKSNTYKLTVSSATLEE